MVKLVYILSAIVFGMLPPFNTISEENSSLSRYKSPVFISYLSPTPFYAETPIKQGKISPGDNINVGFSSGGSIHKKKKRKTVVVWQPSHQTDTGKDFSEAAVCDSIVNAAMRTKPKLKEYKVWSIGQKDLHHADSGSNTVIAHTTAIVDGKMSGYAWELKEANKLHPDVFIAVHNNGGTKRHAVWGYIHYGDQYETANRELAGRLVRAICLATGMEDRGVLLDSTTGRNDYRCTTTGKRGFYSLDENVNMAPYRLLLEIGDNVVSHDFLQDPVNQAKIGEAIKKELLAWLKDKGM